MATANQKDLAAFCKIKWCNIFVFFKTNFIAETRTAYDRNTVIIIGGESQCFELIAADFETINVCGIFWLS